jgi:hypothetical protein
MSKVRVLERLAHINQSLVQVPHLFYIDVLSCIYILFKYYGFTYVTLYFPRLVQVEIHSGRPHQIRIHLAYIGHPLVGKSNTCVYYDGHDSSWALVFHGLGQTQFQKIYIDSKVQNYILFIYQMILSMALVGSLNLMTWNLVLWIFLLHMTGNSFIYYFCRGTSMDDFPVPTLANLMSLF